MINQKSFNTVVVALCALTMLSACRSENPPLTGPPKQPINILPKEHPLDDQAKEGLTVAYDPRVDILFVIDDSASMLKHQQNLKDNLHMFVDQFAKTAGIDFHIGFTNVYDRLRYGIAGGVPQTCGSLNLTRRPEGWAPTTHNWDIAGTLQPMLDTSGKLNGRRFVTKDDDYAAILNNTLDPLINKTLIKELIPNKSNADDFKRVGTSFVLKDTNICPYGPENEELFTPLVNAVEGLGPIAETNKGFRREGALFVAILLSDANDASGLTPEEVNARIAKAVGVDNEGRKRYRIFSVAMKPGTIVDMSQNSKCKPDPVWKAKHGQVIGAVDNNLANLARLTEDGSLPAESQILSICDDNYGDALAKYGAQVRQDILHDVVIELPHRPQVTSNPDKKLNLFLEIPGGSPTKLALKEHEQWDYNAQDVTVIVYAKKVDWKSYPGAKIHVNYTPVVDETSKDSVPISVKKN